MSRKAALIVAGLLVSLGVALGAPKKASKQNSKPRVFVPVESVFRVSESEPSPRAKIFLVAGSSLAASFAREIVAQRKLWLAAGFHEDEIECYYVVPLQEDLNDDEKRFLEVAPELARCHRASVKLLREHLKTTAHRSPKPSFLYLYVSSHGDKPVSTTVAEARKTDEDYWALKRDERYPAFDQYHLVVEGLTDGTATAAEMLGAMRAGMDPSDLYLTPRYLKRLLEEHFAEIPKFLVFQGCYSGGFIEEEPSSRFARDTLASLDRLTVLTAARHDRTSFGCEPGNGATYFGGAYNEVLARYAGDPLKMNWQKLADEVTALVKLREKKEKVDPPSLPQFFSSSSHAL